MHKGREELNITVCVSHCLWKRVGQWLLPSIHFAIWL